MGQISTCNNWILNAGRIASAWNTDTRDNAGRCANDAIGVRDEKRERSGWNAGNCHHVIAIDYIRQPEDAGGRCVRGVALSDNNRSPAGLCRRRSDDHLLVRPGRSHKVPDIEFDVGSIGNHGRGEQDQE